MQYNGRTQLCPREKQCKDPCLLDLLHKLPPKSLVNALIKALELLDKSLLIAGHLRIDNQGPDFPVGQQIDIIVEKIPVPRVKVLAFPFQGQREVCTAHVDRRLRGELQLIGLAVHGADGRCEF